MHSGAPEDWAVPAPLVYFERKQGILQQIKRQYIRLYRITQRYPVTIKNRYLRCSIITVISVLYLDIIQLVLVINIHILFVARC